MTNLETKLWAAADNLWENANMPPQDFKTPVLGLIFLKFADIKFQKATKEIKKSGRKPSKDRYLAKRVVYLPKEARYSYLLAQEESVNIGKLVDKALQEIEDKNKNLAGILPRNYQKINKSVIFDLLKSFNNIPLDTDEDMFGRIYEYFLGKFALTEGKGGGAFYTTSWLVKLIVNIIEPLKGKVLDPSCGSGGMFVQSAEFVKAHNKSIADIAIYGQEKDPETIKLAKMNLAIHGLVGDIKHGNTYYQDIHESIGKFSYVMANPPFNTDSMDPTRMPNKEERFPFGLPYNSDDKTITQNGGNFIWAQLFYSALNDKGRAGFVMSNGASAASNVQGKIRHELIETGHVDVIIACPNKLFYNVQVPCTLWFYDKGKPEERKMEILFIDAREMFQQINAAHRKFTDEQIEYFASVVRLYRKEKGVDFVKTAEKNIKELEEKLEEKENATEKNLIKGQIEIAKELINKWKDNFNKGYQDVAGLCKVADFKELEKNCWVLSPGRYIDIKDTGVGDKVFEDRMKELTGQLGKMFTESDTLEKKIKDNLKNIRYGL